MPVATHTSSDYSDRLSFPVRRFTVEEYHRLGDACVLTEEDDVELLEGLIVPKIIRKPIHDAMVAAAGKTLTQFLPDGWHIRIQMAVTTSDSEPEPDLAIVRGNERDYLTRHPQPEDVALVVEVAETSLERDRNKRQVYARAGIACYWIINLLDSVVEAYTGPSASGDKPQYSGEQTFRADESVPLEIAGQEIASVAATDLLP
jgi:Uma2 family endonuclease